MILFKAKEEKEQIFIKSNTYKSTQNPSYTGKNTMSKNREDEKALETLLTVLIKYQTNNIWYFLAFLVTQGVCRE